MRKTRTGIRIETHEFLTLRASRSSSRLACQQCQGETLMVTPEEAMVLANATAREIYRWVETGQVHYTEGAGRTVLVCPNSILRLTIKSDQAD